MNNIIDAVYENGVFKPLGEVQVKEHEKVTLKVILSDDWGKRFAQIIEKNPAENLTIFSGGNRIRHYPSAKRNQGR